MGELIAKLQDKDDDACEVSNLVSAEEMCQYVQSLQATNGMRSYYLTLGLPTSSCAQMMTAMNIAQ